MDNHIIDIRSNGQEAFEHALHLFMGDQMGGNPTAQYTAIVEPNSVDVVRITEKKTEVVGKNAPTFVLFKSKPAEGHIFGRISPLPYPMEFDIISVMLWNWLQKIPETQWEEHIDLDGSTGRGFRMWNERWGFVGGSSHAFCAVRPIHAWYSK